MENTELKNEEKFEQKVLESSNKIKDLITEVHKKIVGQDELIKSMIIGLLAK